MKIFEEAIMAKIAECDEHLKKFQEEASHWGKRKGILQECLSEYYDANKPRESDR